MDWRGLIYITAKCKSPKDCHRQSQLNKRVSGWNVSWLSQLDILLSPNSLISVEDKKDDVNLDDSNEAANADPAAALKNRIRYSKAQARQRFKKGKF